MFPLRDNIPSRHFPFVNYLFIIVNVGIFLNEVQLHRVGLLEAFIHRYGLIPAQFFGDPFLHFPQVFSSMFLHGSWGHVLGNMWYLYIFGDNVEDCLGHVRYAIYYLLMGIGAAAAQLAAQPFSEVPMIGASGAIAGILGSYFVLFPRAKVLTFLVIVFFVRLIEVPAFFFLGLWFVIQAFNGVGTLAVDAVRGEMGGVAWWAHAGGFLTGFLCIPFLRKRRRSY